MSRFYVRLSLFLLPIFVLLMLVMSTIGSTQPIHPALRGFVEGCEGIPQPCWYGIVPGVTTFEDARTQITMSNFQMISHVPPVGNMWLASYIFETKDSDECGQLTVYVDDANNWIYSLVFEKCPHLFLGDLIADLGAPSEVFYCLQMPYPLVFYRQRNMTIEPQTNNRNMQPYNAINSISIYYDIMDTVYGDWQGFMSFQRYRELEPASIVEVCIG